MRFVAGNDRVVKDLLSANLGHQPELHQGRLLRQMKELQLKWGEKKVLALKSRRHEKRPSDESPNDKCPARAAQA